jgi:hypothetical protein
MSPLARENLSGFGVAGVLVVFPDTVGLCFIRKSRLAPSEKDAIAGSGPRNLSSSLWNEMLSLPEA